VTAKVELQRCPYIIQAQIAVAPGMMSEKEHAEILAELPTHERTKLFEKARELRLGTSA